MVARVHGASARRLLARDATDVSPALAAGMLLAFTLAIEEFGVPAALGSRAGVVMLTVGIEKKLADWPVDLRRRAIVAAADGGGVVRPVAAKAAGGEKGSPASPVSRGRTTGHRWAG